MTVQGSRTAGSAVLLGSDRVELARPAGLAALVRLDRLGRPSGPVLARAGRAAFLLAPGTAEEVPELLDWLGWGPGLGLDLVPLAAGQLRVPPPRPAPRCRPGLRLRGAEEVPPRPTDRPAVWLRHGGHGPGLDLRSPDLLRLLDCLADACARARLGLAP
ncbi:hypothetical protein ACIRBX_09270 [Kitasatospora sp. NPDC096147]|uniref:hypothetical protein n=1 Tax=Kitasatospora sp. NPDC096147 TaxID=3364093 RepID=UPI0037F709A2